jgi:DNA-binding GntR family transcriptional regulator
MLNNTRRRLGRVEARQNLAEETAARLRDAIVGGHFKVGERLGVVDLADRVGVSTMPVREALILLEHEGLVERLPRRGYRVAGVNSGDVGDIFLLHAFLAGVLAERAAQSAPESVFKQLREVHRQTLAAARPTASNSLPTKVEKLNHEFHRLINRSVPSQRLRWFLRTTTRYVPPSFYQSIPGWIETTLEDHPLIIDALERRDAAASKRLMERHVLRGGQLVVDALNNGLGPQDRLRVAGPRP